MAFNTWLLFVIMETALSLSPGPAVFYVVSHGVRGLPRAVPATLGILSANALYFALSATSLGALIAASTRFFAIVKWLGAGYLLYLGVRALRSAASQDVSLDRPGGTGGTVADKPPRRRIYVGALTLQLSNPKALLSFLALLPQFIDTRRPVPAQMLVLAASSIMPEFFILIGYAWLAHRAARASERFGVTGNMNRWLAWIEGVGLIGCAALVVKFSR